jgi:hypothetical protein
MMRQSRICVWPAIAVICSLSLVVGCAPVGEKIAKPEEPITEVEPVAQEQEAAEPEVEPQPPEAPPLEVVAPEIAVPEPAAPETVTLALKFTPQDSTTYRLITEARQTLKWEGAVPDNPAFRSGETSNRIEMTFTRQIQSINNDGSAIAKITIESVKYSSVIMGRIELEFDSSMEKYKKSPLAKLVGQSYTIEIAPTGQVTKIIDVKQAEAAVKGPSATHRRALALLKPEVIRKQHGIMMLPSTDKNQLKAGDKWSRLTAFSFDRLGTKSYERIYTVKEIEDTGDRRIALVEMNAIPTSEMAEQLHKEQQVAADFAKKFDNTETYNGQLKVDLTAGKIEKYVEKLQSQWVSTELAIEEENRMEPLVLVMGAIRLYDMERIE